MSRELFGTLADISAHCVRYIWTLLPIFHSALFFFGSQQTLCFLCNAFACFGSYQVLNQD
jgi:hypothetical protein